MKTFLIRLLLLAAPIAAHAGDIPQKSIVENWPASQNINGIVSIAPVTISSAPITASVSVSTISIKILAANPYRRGLFLYNNSANSCYIAYDSVVSSANHMSFLIATFSTWIMPAPIYTGPIAVIRNSGTGAILITEF